MKTIFIPIKPEVYYKLQKEYPIFITTYNNFYKGYSTSKISFEPYNFRRYKSNIYADRYNISNVSYIRLTGIKKPVGKSIYVEGGTNTKSHIASIADPHLEAHQVYMIYPVNDPSIGYKFDNSFYYNGKKLFVFYLNQIPKDDSQLIEYLRFIKYHIINLTYSNNVKEFEDNLHKLYLDPSSINVSIRNTYENPIQTALIFK